MSSIDKLALVSRLLFEKRIIEQRQEIEELRLELFWKDHNTHALKRAMRVANTNNTSCICVCCSMSQRDRYVNRDEVDRSATCKFAPWFEKQLGRCGLVAVGQTSLHKHSTSYHDSLSRDECLKVDSHFVVGPTTDWMVFRFGERLWKATTADDPELRKLSLLKMYLSEPETDGDSDGGDYPL